MIHWKNLSSGDYVETILYKVFSTLSSSSSVSNLCELLGDEEEIIKGAISTLNRFGFIEKYTEIDMELGNEIPSGSDNDDFQIPASPTPAEKGIVWLNLVSAYNIVFKRHYHLWDPSINLKNLLFKTMYSFNL